MALPVFGTTGHQDGWSVLTDPALSGVHGASYALRGRIEPGFRHIKSEG
jgi:hypothetical protein